jgi:hypothetical protein
MFSNNSSVLLTLFDSKEDLVRNKIKDFLILEDFCNLDSSICNHEKRKKAFNCFIGQRFETLGHYWPFLMISFSNSFSYSLQTCHCHQSLSDIMCIGFKALLQN